MGFLIHRILIHELSALYFILKAPKGPTVGAAISGHALHVLKTALYRFEEFSACIDRDAFRTVCRRMARKDIWAAAKTAYQSQGHAFRHYFLCYSRQNPPQNDVPRHQKSITRGFGTAPYVFWAAKCRSKTISLNRASYGSGRFFADTGMRTVTNTAGGLWK